MTYKQQIQKLRDKNLLVPNESEAIETLRLNGYLHLSPDIKIYLKILRQRIIEMVPHLMTLLHFMNLMLIYEK